MYPCPVFRPLASCPFLIIKNYCCPIKVSCTEEAMLSECRRHACIHSKTYAAILSSIPAFFSSCSPLRRRRTRTRMAMPPQRSERHTNRPDGAVKKRTPSNERSEAFVRFRRQRSICSERSVAASSSFGSFSSVGTEEKNIINHKPVFYILHLTNCIVHIYMILLSFYRTVIIKNRRTNTCRIVRPFGCLLRCQNGRSVPSSIEPAAATASKV